MRELMREVLVGTANWAGAFGWGVLIGHYYCPDNLSLAVAAYPALTVSLVIHLIVFFCDR